MTKFISSNMLQLVAYPSLCQLHYILLIWTIFLIKYSIMALADSRGHPWHTLSGKSWIGQWHILHLTWPWISNHLQHIWTINWDFLEFYIYFQFGSFEKDLSEIAKWSAVGKLLGGPIHSFDGSFSYCLKRQRES